MATKTQSVNPDTAEIAIGGYSPVSYFEKERAEVGSIDHAVTHDGNTYHFASAEQAETFRANPQKYVPAYGGWCAYGTSVGEKFPVDPENFNPGYLTRGMHLMPRQGNRAPWQHSQDYWTEKDELPVADLDDGTLVFN